jgi:Ser/Thr protein kinase RdoA (MazF antagonist)
MLYRTPTDQLTAHLERTYDVSVRRAVALDLGVDRVELGDGRAWIARTFPVGRRVDHARDDARVLHWLAERRLPVEQPAADDPVSVHAGQPVLVTTAVEGAHAAADAASFAVLGDLLGRLHTLPDDAEPAVRRAGGAWHHLLLDGGLGDETAACAELVEDAVYRVGADAPAYRSLRTAVGDLRVFAGLPEAFGHADLVPRNLLTDSHREVAVVIDWTGAGWFPRVAALGALLWPAALTADLDAVGAAARAYAAHVALDDEELAAVPAAMQRRPLICAAWTVATGRGALAKVVARWQRQRSMIERSAPAAVAALRTS